MESKGHSPFWEPVIADWPLQSKEAYATITKGVLQTLATSKKGHCSSVAVAEVSSQGCCSEADKPRCVH